MIAGGTCIRFIETYCRVPIGVGALGPMRLAHGSRRTRSRSSSPRVCGRRVADPTGQCQEHAVGGGRLVGGRRSRGLPDDSARRARRPARAAHLCSDRSRRDGAPQSPSCVSGSWSTRARMSAGSGRRGATASCSAACRRNGFMGSHRTLALLDEAQTVEPDVWNAILQGAGKRDSSLVVAIGTPAPGARVRRCTTWRPRPGRRGGPVDRVRRRSRLRLDDVGSGTGEPGAARRDPVRGRVRGRARPRHVGSRVPPVPARPVDRRGVLDVVTAGRVG